MDKFSGLRKAFHWQYSGVLLPLLLGTAVAFMLTDEYAVAYGFYVIMGVWAVLWWLTHDYVETKKRFLQSQIQRHRLTKRARIAYLKAIAAGVVPILLVVCAGMVYTGRLRTEKSLKDYHGWLYPDDIRDPYEECHPTGNQLAMYVGSYSLMGNSFPQTLIAIDSTPMVIIDRRDDGAIGLSLTLRSDDRRVIVQMDNGEFTVNPNNVLSMFRPDKSQLIIKDQLGNEVLNAHYLNKKVIRLEAKFYQDGRVYDLSTVPVHNVCLARIVPPGTRVTGNMINLRP